MQVQCGACLPPFGTACRSTSPPLSGRAPRSVASRSSSFLLPILPFSLFHLALPLSLVAPSRASLLNRPTAFCLERFSKSDPWRRPISRALYPGPNFRPPTYPATDRVEQDVTGLFIHLRL